MYIYIYMHIYIYTHSPSANVTERVRRHTVQSLWRKLFASRANKGQPGQNL